MISELISYLNFGWECWMLSPGRSQNLLSKNFCTKPSCSDLWCVSSSVCVSVLQCSCLSVCLFLGCVCVPLFVYVFELQWFRQAESWTSHSEFGQTGVWEAVQRPQAHRQQPALRPLPVCVRGRASVQSERARLCLDMCVDLRVCGAALMALMLMCFYFEIVNSMCSQAHTIINLAKYQAYTALAWACHLLQTPLNSCPGYDPAVSYAWTLVPKKHQIINYKNISC